MSNYTITTLDFLVDLNNFLEEQEELGIKYSYTFRGDNNEDRTWIDLEVWIEDESNGEVLTLFDFNKEGDEQ